MSEKTTLLPDYVGIVQDTSVNFYSKSTDLLAYMGAFLAEINENIKFNKGLVTPNVLEAYGRLFNELNSTDFTIENFKVDTTNGNVTPNGVKQVDNSFKLYFIEKYLSLSQKYRTRIDTYIANNKYFIPFSDDIGYVVDVTDIVDCNVSPYFDVFSQKFPLQINAPNTVASKMSLNELKVAKTFSLYADALLKTNLIGLQEGDVNDNTAKTSHGTNLITDILYYERALANQHAFLETLQLILGVFGEFITFFKSLNPQDRDPGRYAVFFQYYITNLEGLELQVDVLKNNINQLSLSSKEVLSVS